MWPHLWKIRRGGKLRPALLRDGARVGSGYGRKPEPCLRGDRLLPPIYRSSNLMLDWGRISIIHFPIRWKRPGSLVVNSRGRESQVSTSRVSDLRGRPFDSTRKMVYGAATPILYRVMSLQFTTQIWSCQLCDGERWMLVLLMKIDANCVTPLKCRMQRYDPKLG